MNLKNRSITIWGDSILKGIIRDDTAEGYRVLDSNCVNRFIASTGASIQNRSSFGMTTMKALERISRSVQKRTPQEDEIILIEFGGNDCDFMWKEVSELPHAGHLPKTPITVFMKNMQSIIDTYISRNLTPLLMTLPPLEPNRYLDWISRGLSRVNILNFLGDANRIYRWQEMYNDAIVDIARANNLRLIDVRRRFLESNHCTDLICDDGIHPNEQGHTLMHQAFMDYIHAC